ncbi:inhibitor of Bruton tyrosine kinase isoform X9 [Pipistrellus kuhlii]|uniref:Inhibitor of Bruton tyrosine kinase n=1 Tax=Pipistrellus kuhlii TaxID=59472 RepID=A0A7J7YMC6_PIPKU|nr:inhibitor of Bruton tyrosine kinase isoform X9 [Pipistrellus kuhlii]KAF6362968.1 inhibitor of Bruton tyrosine kinase [Pipistrellus kuhlii]
MNSSIPDCTSKCRSLKHALDVLSVVTKGSENQIKAFLSSHCYNAATIKDDFGRNALHLVSSCGKKGVLEWLIEKGVDPLVKDKESGWTALHRSIFYGHIDCVWSLLKHGVSLYTQDKEGLSALDLVMKDRPNHVVFKNTDPTDVYTWGDNTNFTLGHGSQNSKNHPELVDLFSRSGVYIKQVVLCKFHSVFLSQKGQVYTCGHGPGGRLGHGDEQTCLVPRLVEGLNGHNCSQVAAAEDHTIVLTEDGCIYTFGQNTFHQLGIIPPPSICNVPRQMQAKYLKGRTIIGVAAGRFHTVLWTKEAVYTMGLNGGQLGYLLDPNGEKYVTAPRQVSALHHKDITLSLVAASDGATVCVTTRGDIYLLTDYQCKKIASKQLNLKKVLVSGGRLEYKVDPEHLKENASEKICILAMDGAGRVFCWRSVSSSLKQCRWAYPRQVFISDIALNRNEILFVTQDGEGFRGKWFDEKRKSSEKKEILSNLHNSSSDVSCVPDTNSVYERIRLEKLTFAHRAVSVSTDPSGCNFAILQSDPKTRLDGVRFENEKINVIAKKTGNKPKLNQKKCSFVYDVTMKSVDGKEFPCHKCVLCARLDYFHSMLSSSWIEASNCAALEMPIQSDILKVILDYLYTDEAVLIKESQNVDFICSVLVVADQLLITRLKEICEVALTEKLTLKNAAMLLEFAAMYNAEQLKLSCLQFIVLNMAALLEARSLDVLSVGVLKDLSAFYRKMIPAMDKRVITPYQDGPDISYLELEDGDIFLKEEINMEQNNLESMFKKAKTKAKKKPRKRSDSSGGYNLSDIIQSLPSTGLLKSGKTNSVESLPELLTSDSEGSYAGVGSPRDLQSPDFTTAFHSDKIEGKKKPYVNGTPPTYFREDLKPWEKSPILKISAPQPIPSNRIDSSSSSSWAAGSFSPVSPPIVDLRTIMQIEENRQKCGATPKTNLGKVVSSGVKLSQKQRKMIAMTTKENNSGVNSMETALTAPSKTSKPAHAWGSSLHSFRDFIEEKKSITGHSAGDHVKKVCFKGIENPQAPKVARCSTHGTPGPEEVPLLESHNPWLSSSLTASPVAPVTFASIVEEELQQEAALIRSREKPLALIQIEEHAIQDLLVYYEAFGNPEEFVVVERTPQGPLAVPMWNKHGF